MTVAKSGAQSASPVFHVAAAQYPISEPKSLAEWQAKIATWVADGAATGADLLVFPEYAAIEQAAFLGPAVSTNLEETLAAVADLAEARVAFHATLARKHGVHILVGSGPVRAPDHRYVNAAQLVTPEGKVGVQEKLIMTPFERDWGISPATSATGKPIRVFETALGRIGIAICYDSEFPLLVRAMAEAGAETLLVPSCTERLAGFQRIRAAATARALENQMTVVTSPTVGDALWSPAVDRNTGAAGIFVPADSGFCETGVVAEGKLNDSCWVTAPLDRRLAAVRTTGDMRNYTDWTLQPGAAPLAAHVDVVDLR